MTPVLELKPLAVSTIVTFKINHMFVTDVAFFVPAVVAVRGNANLRVLSNAAEYASVCCRNALNWPACGDVLARH